MLLVDERIGSRDLLRPLMLAGVPAELAHLEYGDFAFIGKGLNGVDLYIGIELKETMDLLASFHSARFSGRQLPGLIATYDRVWLITEGTWRAGGEGVMETLRNGFWSPVSVGRRRVMASDLDAWILTQVIRGGIHHWHGPTRRDTIRFISTLFHWWTNRNLEEHRSHEVIYLTPPDRATFIEPSTERKMLSCVPKVGWDKSSALLTHFDGSLRAVLAATPDELKTIDGIGPVIAANLKAVK